MPSRRPSTATAVLVAVMVAAGLLGLVAPVAQRAEAVASVGATAPTSGQRTVVDTDERAAAASRADRASRRERVAVRALSDRTLRPISFGMLQVVVERIERRQARIKAAREAARRARERQEYLDRWVMPIHSYSWSAGFGEAGWMWSSGYHTGQDWTAPYGTPVYAAARGSISFAGWSGAYGNKLVITNYDGSQSWYAHLDSFARTGGTVAAGDLVGYVGCSGNCYGPHLHYEIHLSDGNDVDPVDWLRRRGAL